MALDLLSRIEQLRQDLPAYASDLDFAFQYVESDPSGSLSNCRLCTERLIEELYKSYHKQDPPQKGDPLNEPVLQRVLGKHRLVDLRYVRELANHAAHVNDEPPTTRHAEKALIALCDVLEWWRDHNSHSGRGRRPSRPSRGDDSSSNIRTVQPTSQAGDESRPSRRPRTLLRVGVVAIALALCGAGLWALRSGTQTIISDAVDDVGRSVGLPRLPGATQALPTGTRVDLATPPVVTPASESPAKPISAPLFPPTAGPDDASWSRQQSRVTVDLYSVQSDSAGQVYVSGAAGTVLVTGDGGRTWRKAKIGTTASLFALAQTGDGQVFAAGAQGALLFLSNPDPDGTPRFRPRPLPHRADLWAAYGHPNKDMFVGGDQGVLLQLAPDGSVRHEAEHKGSRIQAITQWDEKTLYAAGVGGTLLRGELRGAIAYWQPIAVRETGTFWGLLRRGNELLIAGEFDTGRPLKEGMVLHGDSVQGWRRSRAPFGINPVYSLVGLSSNAAIAAGYLGQKPYLLHSQDSGTTWNKQAGDELLAKMPIGKYAIGGSRFGDLFLVGPKGIILHKRQVGTDTSQSKPL